MSCEPEGSKDNVAINRACSYTPVIAGSPSGRRTSITPDPGYAGYAVALSVTPLARFTVRSIDPKLAPSDGLVLPMYAITVVDPAAPAIGKIQFLVASEPQAATYARVTSVTSYVTGSLRSFHTST